MYFLTLLDIFLLSYIYNILKNGMVSKFKFNLLVKSYIDLFKCIIYTFFFILLFLIFFRLVRLFIYSNNNVLDLKFLLFLVLKIVKILGLYEKIMFLYVFVFLFFLFKLFRKYFFIFFRVQYLKLHYLFFIKNKLYLFIFNKTKSIDTIIYCYFNNKFFYNIYLFLQKKLFIILIIFFFIKSMLFNEGVMYIGFFKYYFVFIFFIKIKDYLHNFESDFDNLIAQNYYSEYFEITEMGKNKYLSYEYKIIYGVSNKRFLNSIIYDFTCQYPEDWIFCFCYNEYEFSNYTLNFCIKNVKPNLAI